MSQLSSTPPPTAFRPRFPGSVRIRLDSPPGGAEQLRAWLERAGAVVEDVLPEALDGGRPASAKRHGSEADLILWDLSSGGARTRFAGAEAETGGAACPWIVLVDEDDAAGLEVAWASRHRCLTTPVRELDLLFAVADALDHRVPSFTTLTELATRHFGLSRQQAAVFHHTLEGRSNAEIGRALALSSHTVNTYVTQVLRRAGAKSRAGLLAALATHAKRPAASCAGRD